MKRTVWTLLLAVSLAALAVPAAAQTTPPAIADLERLAKQASKSVIITLDKNLLIFAAKFLPKNDPDTAKIRDLISQLDGIHVRVLEFDRDGVYQMSEVENLRRQLIKPGWSRLVEVRGKDENVDMYMNQDGEKILGLTIISAEPRELVVVNVSGPIRPEQLADLEGFAGIPRINAGRERESRRRLPVEREKKDDKKDEKKDE